MLHLKLSVPCRNSRTPRFGPEINFPLSLVPRLLVQPAIARPRSQKITHLLYSLILLVAFPKRHRPRYLAYQAERLPLVRLDLALGRIPWSADESALTSLRLLQILHRHLARQPRMNLVFWKMVMPKAGKLRQTRPCQDVSPCVLRHRPVPGLPDRSLAHNQPEGSLASPTGIRFRSPRCERPLLVLWRPRSLSWLNPNLRILTIASQHFRLPRVSSY